MSKRAGGYIGLVADRAHRSTAALTDAAG